VNLNLPDGNQMVLINGNAVDINGIPALALTDHEKLQITSGTGHNVFVVKGTLPSTQTALDGGMGTNAFNIGSTPQKSDGNLDSLKGVMIESSPEFGLN
jgi:hypothetical protein